MAEAFTQLWLKRRAQYSTVAFVKTSDPKRREPFIRFLYSIFSSSSLPFEIYLYVPWGGLFNVTVRPVPVPEQKKTEGGEEQDSGEKRVDYVVEYTPVAAQQQLGPLSGVVAPQPIRELPQALAYLDERMRKAILARSVQAVQDPRERGPFRVVAIFWGLTPFKNVTDPEFALLTRFLRNAIFSYEYYAYHTIVIFTEHPELVTDEDTLRRSIVVDVEPSTLEEREALLKDIAAKLGIQVDGARIRMLAEAMRGLTLHEVESVALESIYRFGGYNMAAMTAFKYDVVRKQGLLDVEEPAHGFEAVGGYDALKDFVKSTIIKVFENPERAKALGIEPPRGLLLFGPPGTGKTWFARALAKELKLPFLRLRSEKIHSMWYGETTRLMAQALRLAENVAPCVLFIDEIDRFGRRGGLTEHEETRRAFSVLLEWLGDTRRKTIVVGTTNRIQDMDEAMIRVGRMDYAIPVLYPDLAAREEILYVHTHVVRKVPLKNVNLREIALQTELWSGAELAELVLRAARLALERDMNYVTKNEFMDALSTFRINYEERLQQLNTYLALAEKFTNDQRFLERLKRSIPSVSRLEALKSF